jgi:hypothetical protein
VWELKFQKLNMIEGSGLFFLQIFAKGIPGSEKI